MFRCKFCLKDVPLEEMSTGHKGMCKTCYNNITRYRRLIIKQCVNEDERKFMRRFELQCRHNTAVREYVPKCYSRSVDTTIDECPGCGRLNKRVSPYNSSICYDCWRLENNYRSLLRRFKTIQELSDTSVQQDRRFEDTVVLLRKYEMEFMEKHNRGFLTPKIFRDKFGL